MLLVLLPHELSAQSVAPGSMDLYGLDPLLFNGRYYSFYITKGTIGDPFLQGTGFLKGSVTVRGVNFDNLDLNYDVYNQQLVLKYLNRLGAVNQIIVSDAWLEGFTLDDMHFCLLQNADTTKRIYRVFGSGEITLLRYYSKTLALDNQLSSRNFRFSNLRFENYLRTSSGMRAFKGNRNFVSLFDAGKQPNIRKYLHEKRIRLRKAGDRELTELITYCNQL
ncbi:MAG TPA: hypothetical protein PLP88_00665 [Bacteroidales bacterium]|nr:hypothetical protein [Bacteroidales bacterium]